MAFHEEIEAALAAIAAGLNEQGLDELDTGSAQALVTEACGGRPALTVDDGGGLHDASGVRVGAIRRTDSGEWITERQNDDAWRSSEKVPSPPPWSKLRALLTRLHVRG
jgi:hypothetical protein